MHPAALGATSYTLLLSSFVTLVILLRRRCKSKAKSPFHTLSTSDVLSATLTAVILLANHIEAVIRLSYNSQNTSDTSNRTWIIERDEDKYELPFPPINNLRDAVNEVDLNVTLTCDMKDVYMQYGILLAALTNAFVSLLTFAVQCNLNAACVKRRCASVMESSGNTKLEAKAADVKRRRRGILEDEQESTFQSRDIKSSFIRRIMKISRSQQSQVNEDNRKPVGFLITSHWFMPFLVVGALYFAEYSDMSILRHTEDVECVFESNFPMFYVFSDPENKPKPANSIVHVTPLENSYLINKELSNMSTPSIIEVDQIVSKVQNIVRTALNYARNSTQSISLLDDSRSQNMTKYIVANNIMNYITNNTNVNNVTRRLNSTLMERDVSINDSPSNLLNDQNTKVSFRDLLKNASEESDTTLESLSSVPSVSAQDAEDALIYFKENTTEKTGSVPIVRSGASISNNQIYNEIMKRIQAASAHAAKRNNSKGYVAKRKPNSIKDLLASKIDDFNTEMQSDSFRMTNECLISIKFLKLHLFVLCFTVYFLSILLFCILQMRGKYMCKNTLAILRARTDLPIPSLCSNVDSKKDSSVAVVDEPHSEFRLSTDSKEISRENSMGGSNSLQGPRNDHGSRTGAEETRKDQSYKEMQNKSIFLEINCMLRILNIIKISLILCVILWTPALLGTLLKVFSCTRMPQWLTDATFLSAVSFGIIRNILNINIMKIQEACGDASKKENRIHPIK
ncbi:uncharacterized protein [Linepithema humile]|uniref:uncharacterized protein n=1 Tax=Linepithema humile TaxID=83485 RepID=UPI00351F11A8